MEQESKLAAEGLQSNCLKECQLGVEQRFHGRFNNLCMMSFSFYVLLLIVLSTLTCEVDSFKSQRHSRISRHLPLRLLTTKGSTLLDRNADTSRETFSYDSDEPEPISSTDTAFYYLLASFQVLPPLALVDLPEPLDSIRRPVSYLYFIVTASILVALGAKRQDIKQGPQQKPISLKSAVLAPAISSAVIFTIYLLLKYTNVEIYFDRVYQFLGMQSTPFRLSHLV